MMRPVPPGEVLQEQLEELSMSATQLAAHLGVPTNRITLILKGERSLTADTALRLSKFFGTTAEFWLALQSNYDLRKAELEARPSAEIIPLTDVLRQRMQEKAAARARSATAGRVARGRFVAKKRAAKKAAMKTTSKGAKRRAKKA
jgi:antitoxin HigA-1